MSVAAVATVEGDERSRAKQLRLVESTGLCWRTARPNCQENCSPVLPLHRTAIPHHPPSPARFTFSPMCFLVRDRSNKMKNRGGLSSSRRIFYRHPELIFLSRPRREIETSCHGELDGTYFIDTVYHRNSLYKILYGG